MKTGFIYLVTNNVTGKKYVGATIQGLAIRWEQHWKQAKRGKGWAFQAAIRKYGKENFVIEELAETFESCLPTLEVFFIALHNTTNSKFGYNLTKGGDGVPCTAEMRRKMSEGQKKRAPMTEEARLNRSRAQTGRKQSPEQCAANGDRKRGVKHSAEHIAKREASRKERDKTRIRKPISEETRAKMSLAKKGKLAPRIGWTHTEETKRLISLRSKVSPAAIANRVMLAESRKGKPSKNKGFIHSEETKAKLSLVRLGKPWTEPHHATIRARREAKLAQAA